jgi:hypothetical protein
MGRTVADLKALREQLTMRRWQAAYAVADDQDGEGLYVLVTFNAAILALDAVINEGRDEP